MTLLVADEILANILEDHFPNINVDFALPALSSATKAQMMPFTLLKRH